MASNITALLMNGGDIKPISIGSVVVGQCKMSADQVLYVIPHQLQALPSTPLLLSELLAKLSEMHIFVSETRRPDGVVEHVITDCVLTECIGVCWQPASNPGTIIYDVIISDDVNVMLGVCRMSDHSF